MKSTALSDEILAMGLYSIDLVNLSTATSTRLNPPGATIKGPIMSRLQQANDHDGGIVIKLCWDVRLLAEELAARTPSDQVFCVRDSCWPEES